MILSPTKTACLVIANPWFSIFTDPLDYPSAVCLGTCTPSLHLRYPLLSCSGFCNKLVFLFHVHDQSYYSNSDSMVVVVVVVYSMNHHFIIILHHFLIDRSLTDKENTQTVTKPEHIFQTTVSDLNMRFTYCELRNTDQQLHKQHPPSSHTDMSFPLTSPNASPTDVLLLQEQLYPNPNDICLPVEFTSQHGHSSDGTLLVHPTPKVPLQQACQKCIDCEYYQRVRLRRASTCKCGHARKWHVMVDATQTGSINAPPSAPVDMLLPISSALIKYPSLSHLEIVQSKMYGTYGTAYDFSKHFRTVSKQVTPLRIHALSTPNLAKKIKNFFSLSDSRVGRDHLVPQCGIVFTGVPTPRTSEERSEFLATLLRLSPYDSMFDRESCLSWLQTVGMDCYLDNISQPNNGALYLPCRIDINVYAHLAADKWDHSNINMHLPWYAEFDYFTLGKTIASNPKDTPKPSKKKKPWTIGAQLIDGSLFQEVLAHKVAPPDTMCHNLLYCLLPNAACVADAAFNLLLDVKTVLHNVAYSAGQHVQVLISRFNLNQETRDLTVYLLTVQCNQVSSQEKPILRDAIHRHFLTSEPEDITPVLIGAHLVYCSASHPAIVFLARHLHKRNQLLFEHLFQPLTVTLTTAAHRQTDFILRWLPTKCLGVSPSITTEQGEHPNFPHLQDICFPRPELNVTRNEIFFLERGTKITLKYSVDFKPKLEESLNQSLQKQQKDFYLSSSGFTDCELADRLADEYKALTIQPDLLTAEDIIKLQEDLNDSQPSQDLNRHVAFSHPDASPQSKNG